MSVGRTHSEFITPIKSWAQKQEIESCSSSDSSEQMNFLPFILKDEPQRTIPDVSPARLTNDRSLIRKSNHKPLRTSIKVIIAGVIILLVVALLYYIVSSFVSLAYIFSVLKIIGKVFVCILACFIAYAIICIA